MKRKAGRAPRKAVARPAKGKAPGTRRRVKAHPPARRKAPARMSKRKQPVRPARKAVKARHPAPKARKPAPRHPKARRPPARRTKAKAPRKAVKRPAHRKHAAKKAYAAKRISHPKKRAAPKRKAAAARKPAIQKPSKPSREPTTRVIVRMPAPTKAPDGAKPEFNIKVQNIVAFANLGKPVSLELLLKKVENTEWQPEQFPGLVYKLKYPRASALIFSQGKIVCTGTKSIGELKAAMKKIVDRIRQAGVDMPRKFEIKVENIVASTKINANLNLDEIAFMLENSEYEPEQFPGLVYRISEPRVAFLLFTSGRIICAGAQDVESIQRALHKFRENLEAIGVKVAPVLDE